jgi:hypothetical protein
MFDRITGADKDAQAHVAARRDFWKQEKIKLEFAPSVTSRELSRAWIMTQSSAGTHDGFRIQLSDLPFLGRG